MIDNAFIFILGPDGLPRTSADTEFGPASAYRRNKKKEPRRHRRGGPALWQPTQSQYNDPYNNRAINGVGANNYDRYDNSNTDPYGRNKDDIVFALRKLQQNRTQGNGETGNRLTDDQRLQALDRAPGEGRASIALASFDNYGELLCLLHVQSFQLLLGNYVIHIENYILRISNYCEQ